MHSKLIAVLGSLLLLAACSSAPETGGQAGAAAGTAAAGAGAGGAGAGVSATHFAPGSQQDLKATAGDRVFFAFDRSDITPEARQILERQAQWLRRYPNVTVTVAGHCDERGTREYNLALGARRAQAVKDVLVAMGIPAGRIQTISYGKDRPIVVGSNEWAWAQNRVAITTVN